ncbi:MAG: sulfite exporter TauE/SafE family protein [Rhodospirillaceae bacterium]|nr:sulfite exporter TauE/SafE family protein [Rhodospirillaceae bacterium]
MANLIVPELPLIFGLLMTGALSGFLAGLLGVGGGIIIVPVLFTALGAVGVDPSIRLHMAIGTSLATIIPTSISSVIAHHKRGAVDWRLFRVWLPGIVTGVIVGTWLATTQFSGSGLAFIFAGITLAVAIDLILRDRPDSDGTLALSTPAPWYGKYTASWVPGLIGILSALMGIGGGTLSVPFLNAVKYPMHRAVATSAGFGLIIAMPATLGYVIGGWGVADQVYASFGYVNALGFVIISGTTVLTAPLGSRVAHAIKARTLRYLFSGFLFLTAARMFFAF